MRFFSPVFLALCLQYPSEQFSINGTFFYFSTATAVQESNREKFHEKNVFYSLKFNRLAKNKSTTSFLLPNIAIRKSNTSPLFSCDRFGVNCIIPVYSGFSGLPAFAKRTTSYRLKCIPYSTVFLLPTKQPFHDSDSAFALDLCKVFQLPQDLCDAINRDEIVSFTSFDSTFMFFRVSDNILTVFVLTSKDVPHLEELSVVSIHYCGAFYGSGWFSQLNQSSFATLSQNKLSTTHLEKDSFSSVTHHRSFLLPSICLFFDGNDPYGRVILSSAGKKSFSIFHRNKIGGQLTPFTTEDIEKEKGALEKWKEEKGSG
jgi:hypothetical protein